MMGAQKRGGPLILEDSNGLEESKCFNWFGGYGQKKRDKTSPNMLSCLQ